MNIKVYIIGSKLEKFFTDAIKEYEKRLSRYCKIQRIIVKDDVQLQKKLSNKSYTIHITCNGSHLSSEELAQKINNWGVSGVSDLSFIIGDLPHTFDEQFAISTMNMDVGLQGAALFEQIYRAYRILNNQPYHK